MSNKWRTLQDPFLNALRRERIPVSMFLVNGIKLQGRVESFDQFVVILKNTTSQMVFKHTISTIVPAHQVDIAQETVATAQEAESDEKSSTPRNNDKGPPVIIKRPRLRSSTA